LGKVAFPVSMLLISAIVSTIMFTIGLVYFKQMERHFADII